MLNHSKPLRQRHGLSTAGFKVMLRVEYARWDQTPADLRELSMSASHPRTRERFLALYEIT
ncbi:MAG TPA: hypothetical protein VEY92_03360, partial [Pseudoxanthomonas sp.]|nr:hypothetical protein [Pseudoxanthomonas sp.]